jgi:hypothetical protein
LLGQHMNHCGIGRVTLRGGRALSGSALAGQLGLTTRQRAGGIRAALRLGARIVLAHRGGQRIQPLIERRGIGGMNVGPDPAIPGLVSPTST